MAKVGLFVGSLAGLLVGCAAPEKQPAPASVYWAVAGHIVMAEKCGASGRMSPEIAAYVLNNATGPLLGYTPEFDRLSSDVTKLRQLEPTTQECNTLAVQAMAHRARAQESNEWQAKNAANAQQMLNAVTPKRTVCNTIGTQTLCSTY